MIIIIIIKLIEDDQLDKVGVEGGGAVHQVRQQQDCTFLCATHLLKGSLPPDHQPTFTLYCSILLCITLYYSVLHCSTIQQYSREQFKVLLMVSSLYCNCWLRSNRQSFTFLFASLRSTKMHHQDSGVVKILIIKNHR